MNNIFHIFIIAVFSGKLRIAFSAAAVYKIFKMLYGVNKPLSTYQFPSAFYSILFLLNFTIYKIFYKTQILCMDLQFCILYVASEKSF